MPLTAAGARPVALGALIGLGDAARVAARLSLPFHVLETLTSTVWSAQRCPLCRHAIPLDRFEADGAS